MYFRVKVPMLSFKTPWVEDVTKKYFWPFSKRVTDRTREDGFVNQEPLFRPKQSRERKSYDIGYI